MGAYAALVLSAIVPPSVPVLWQDDNEGTSAVYKGCFTGYRGPGLPTG